MNAVKYISCKSYSFKNKNEMSLLLMKYSLCLGGCKATNKYMMWRHA